MWYRGDARRVAKDIQELRRVKRMLDGDPADWSQADIIALRLYLSVLETSMVATLKETLEARKEAEHGESELQYMFP